MAVDGGGEASSGVETLWAQPKNDKLTTMANEMPYQYVLFATVNSFLV
jgi:hypothetical protein